MLNSNYYYCYYYQSFLNFPHNKNFHLLKKKHFKHENKLNKNLCKKLFFKQKKNDEENEQSMTNLKAKKNEKINLF